MSAEITVRFATSEDCPLLLRLIRELAIFERAPDARNILAKLVY